ncbi:MAG TPA: hypothetical protein PKX79_06665 [Spirochaetota bacterium]|jgi:hypothetical protein|nr:MAG: hypothetical protein BWY23_00143 [Spirochaetes bacterium ADurb.Bin218]HOK02327.1 hypothetical protein [Spirochaetota bacterium]HOK92535.1 hypothetical protein [Spirochaetota bacterium]HON15287.1 hypothetical protein [Spirochaetota bacterium]HOQ13326.1 hypothetical protein [Spirochaetota bacterium]
MDQSYIEKEDCTRKCVDKIRDSLQKKKLSEGDKKEEIDFLLKRL